MYEHEHPTPAHTAVVNCGITTVSLQNELDYIDRLEEIFTKAGLDFITGGEMASLSSIQGYSIVKLIILECFELLTS